MANTTMTLATNWVVANRPDFIRAVTYGLDKAICYPWDNLYSWSDVEALINSRVLKTWFNVAYILWCSSLVYHIKPKNIYNTVLEFMRLLLCIYVLYILSKFIVSEFIGIR